MRKKQLIPSKHQQKNQKLQKKITEYFLKNPKKPLNYKQIASGMNITQRRDIDLLIKQLQKMVAKKQLLEESPGKYRIDIVINTAIGKIEITRSGSAYLIVEGREDDVYISKKNIANAFNNDIVKARLIEGKSKTEGKVLEVLSRSSTEFVGLLQLDKENKFGFVIVDKQQMHVDIFIHEKNLNGAKNGEKVIVEIVEWPKKEEAPYGKIIEVLGKAGDHEVEIHSVLAGYGLPYRFPEEVEIEAKNIDTTISEDEIAKRRDMRNITTFTIDPKDAKDFDDALSIEKLKNGNWEIGIHIADVSHYVTPGSLLDEEALKRATSVYLVDRVVPMLPEKLSNEVCSLRPHEEKYTFSAVFEMNNNAEVMSQWFGRTVIYSDRRFTYEEAQEILETDKGDFKDEIKTLDTLAKILRNHRLNEGALAFDKSEIKFKLDANNEPVGVYIKESKDSNHLIEEFMLLANRSVSKFVSLKKNNVPTNNTFIYRIHDNPNPEKLQALREFVKTFGYDIQIENNKKVAQSLNKLLKEVKGKGESNMIETLTLRSMSKAIYSTDNIGHYGLSFQYYSHFTSPIRRYPDILAHRLLQHYLDQKKSPPKEEYQKMSNHSSEREKLATDAERESIKYMQVKFMDKHIGEVFDGIISGVTEWGIFVETKYSQAEGLIKYRDLRDDHYIYDAKTHSAYGQKTKNKYRLGDDIKIKIINTNIEKKQIDFAIVL